MDFDILNKRLNEKGINQKDLAEQLGVTQAAVSQWKKRDGKLRIETFVKILDILDIGADELLGRERPAEQENKKIENALTEQQKYLIKLTNQFNDEYMEKLIEQAEMYAIRQKEKEKSFNFQSPEKNNAS